MVLKTVSTKLFDNDLTWSEIQTLYNELHSTYETYEKNNVFTVKSEKSIDIESFFSNKNKHRNKNWIL